MACHNAVQFLQRDGKFYKDIVGAHSGLFGTTAFRAMVNSQVKAAKARGFDRLDDAEVVRRGLEDLRAISRDLSCIGHQQLVPRLEVLNCSTGCVSTSQTYTRFRASVTLLPALIK